VNKRKKNISTETHVERTEFASSIMKRQFRFSDWIAERVIKTIAFMSITFVALIFIFVFRETLPIFRTAKQPVKSLSIQTQENEGTMKPEVYDPGNVIPQPALKPETYGAEVADLSQPGGSAQPSTETSTVTANQENRNALSTLLSKDWQPVSDRPRYGLLPLFLGTLKITLIAILFAAPIAILAAIYTALFAPAKIREFIKPAVELLAGFPSVVVGFFALMVLASFFQDLFGYSSRLNGFVGGIAMALAAIPVIYTLTEDALTAVPGTYIEASLGLGASLRQTAFMVVLPTATPGIFAAVLLGIGRVFGETMIALMATGNAALMTVNPFDSVRTLSATIGAEMAEVVFGDTHYSVLFLIGSLLFIFTFILNALAEFYFRNRLIRRFQGK
jgi:phosphate transport system permease protein